MSEVSFCTCQRYDCPVHPAVGLLDDAGAIIVGLEICHKDIEAYRQWQKLNGKR